MTMSRTFHADIKKAYITLWVILSSAVFLLISGILFTDEAHIYGFSSMLQAHHDGVCSFCGMTRSFVGILKGSSHGAIINEAAFPLFSLLAINQFAFIIYICSHPGSRIFKNKKAL